MNKTIKIAALVPYKVFPAKMGGQKGIALFYEYLSALVPVTLIATKNNEPPAGHGYNFLPVLGNAVLRYINPFLFFKLKKITREQGHTHLVLEHPYFGWLGWLLKKNTGIELVIHSHNIEALRFKSTGSWWWRILWHYEKFVHRTADQNFFISDEDKSFAIANFKLLPEKCHTITYGYEFSAAPTATVKKDAGKILRKLHGISAEATIVFFNGTLDYAPNLDALDNILQKINPLLLDATKEYAIIICGKNLPSSYNNLEAYKNKRIIYAGFVDDISVYFNGADIFINPVTDGGGIKTKLVEALGAGLSCVSTRRGATGVPPDITGGKMKLVNDDDWKGFADEINNIDPALETPGDFFDYFYWGNIAAKAALILQYKTR